MVAKYLIFRCVFLALDCRKISNTVLFKSTSDAVGGCDEAFRCCVRRPVGVRGGCSPRPPPSPPPSPAPPRPPPHPPLQPYPPPFLPLHPAPPSPALLRPRA